MLAWTVRKRKVAGPHLGGQNDANVLCFLCVDNRPRAPNDKSQMFARIRPCDPEAQIMINQVLVLVDNLHCSYFLRDDIVTKLQNNDSLLCINTVDSQLLL